MSYTKQEFKQGDVLRAAQLNAMDNAIASVEERVTDMESNESYATKDYVDNAITNAINASY